MIRKLNLITIIFISMLLMPLPLYAIGGGHGGFGGHGFGHDGGFHQGHFDHGHLHHDHFSSSFFLGVGFGALALSPFVIYPYYTYPHYVDPYASYPSAGQSYGDLEINVTPEDVEIYVDGRFIGLAKDFKGPVIAAVPSGSHVVEFRYNGATSSNNVYVAPGSKSAVSGEFKPTPGSSKEFFTPQSYRDSPTIYLEESSGFLKLDAGPDNALIY